VAQAFLPVRLCLASVLSILGEQLTINELFSVLSPWLAAAQPGMAVPQRPNLRASGRDILASGTGTPACALLPYCKITSSKILEGQFVTSELSSVLSRCLRQHSQEWLCHKDQI